MGVPGASARSAGEGSMESAECIRLSDPAVVARYLQLRSVLHDRHLARVDRLFPERYEVQPARRMPATLALSRETSAFVEARITRSLTFASPCFAYASTKVLIALWGELAIWTRP